MILQKQIIKRKISIFLAFLTLWSTTGFSYSMHFCQGSFEGVKSELAGSCCSSANATCVSKAYKSDHVDSCKKDCCINKKFEKERSATLSSCQYSTDNEQNAYLQDFTDQLSYRAVNPYLKERIKFFLYSPPLILFDFYSTHQVFLI